MVGLGSPGVAYRGSSSSELQVGEGGDGRSFAMVCLLQKTPLRALDPWPLHDWACCFSSPGARSCFWLLGSSRLLEFQVLRVGGGLRVKMLRSAVPTYVRT